MHDRDFDKLFSHKFSQLPGSPYEEGNWTALAHRLNAHERRRRRLWLPLFLLLTGLLACGNLFWWHQWREATNSDRRQDKQTVVMQTDTVIHTTVVHLYDTVYRYAAVPVQRWQATSFSSSISKQPGAATSEKNDLNPVASVEIDKQQEQKQVQEPGNTASAQTQNDAVASPGHPIVRAVPVDSIETSVSTPVTGDSMPDRAVVGPTPTIEPVRPPVFYIARPRIGLSAGWAIPSLPHKRSGSAFTAGIAADVEIMRNLRLGGEIGFMLGKIKADEADALEHLGIAIPHPGNDFRLKYWETYQLPAFTYVMQLRYQIPLAGKWSPWVGAGAQAVTYLPFDIEYEFESNTNNLEIHAPGTEEARTRWQGMRFMLGAGYSLSPRLRLGAEVFLLQHFHEEPALFDQQFGLKTGLSYHF